MNVGMIAFEKENIHLVRLFRGVSGECNGLKLMFQYILYFHDRRVIEGELGV